MFFSQILLSLAMFLAFYKRMSIWLLVVIIIIINAFFIFGSQKHGHEQKGILSLDFYAQKSQMCFYSSAYKAILCFSSLIFCIISNSPLFCLLIFGVMLVVTLCWGKTPGAYFISLFHIPCLFIVLSSLAILVQFTSMPMGYLDVPAFGGYIAITYTSQQTALLIMARAVSAVSCLYTYTLSTPMAQTIALLRRIRCPDIIIELMYLIYRYIFILLNIRYHIDIAVKARLGNRTLKTSYRAFFYSAGSLLIVSFKKANQNFEAMESRCYDGSIQFLTPRYAIQKKQIFVLLSYLAFLIAGYAIMHLGV